MAPTTLRCLAIQQPWAWLICAGAKTIENRSWSTDHRGTIAILASTSKTRVNAALKAAKPTKLPTAHFTYGAIVGVADLVDCTPLGPELEDNPWAFGPYCLALRNARLFAEPIPAKGKLNLYYLDETLDALVRARMLETHAPSADVREVWDAATRLDAVTTFHERAGNYLALEKAEHALHLCDAYLEKHPEDLAARHHRGFARYQSKDLAGARAELDFILARDPEDALAFVRRSVVRGELGDEAGAEADLARALELDPEILGEDEDAGEEPSDE